MRALVVKALGPSADAVDGEILDYVGGCLADEVRAHSQKLQKLAVHCTVLARTVTASAVAVREQYALPRPPLAAAARGVVCVRVCVVAVEYTCVRFMRCSIPSALEGVRQKPKRQYKRARTLSFFSYMRRRFCGAFSFYSCRVAA